MPRVYLTPAELSEMPLGVALSSQIGQLTSGVLDKLLARVSQRVDSYVEKRLQAPGSSTLSAPVSAGISNISVVSTLTLDNLAEQAVIIDGGSGLQETVQIQSGGISVSSWTAPYPGTITLAAPLQFGHSSNAPVQYLYKEVSEAIKASQTDPYSEALQSQAAQLALAHLPPMHVGLTRLVFLKHYPVQTVYTVEHAYSFDTTYNPIYDASNSINTGGIILEPTAGYLRFRVGTVVTPEGLVRTAYTAGYQAIPDDVKLACSYYMMDELSPFFNALGAVDLSMGKRRQSFAMQQGKTPNVARAEEILASYRRTV